VSLLRFSIRNQLLLLGALATGSIWAGALLQYVHLREQSNHLAQVQRDLQSAGGFSELARYAAQERGLGNGWLLRRSGGNPAELSEARTRVDASLRALRDSSENAIEPAIESRAEQLARYRGQIDRREIPAPVAFAYYTGFVGAVQDQAAHRLRDGMVQVALSYEHVNHLQRAAELLAQVRGLVNGALSAELLTADTEQLLAWQLTLHKEYMRLFELSAPSATRVATSAQTNAPAVRDTIELATRLLALKQTRAVGLDAARWWTLATEAVDTLRKAAVGESASLTRQAEDRIQQIQRQLLWTVVVLVVLGLVTLGLVLATVGRIVRSLDRLLEGLDGIGTRRNFKVRIDDSRRDEFGTISTGINKLIAIAGLAMDEQEALTLTDPLTGAMNRRGFDRQLAARTQRDRAHRVPFCLVMIDVDHFKSINDGFGHAQGDAVLQQLAGLLPSALRPDDVLARFGGEEFVALLTGCELADGLLVAEKLRSAVEQHDFGLGRPVTASFGVARWNETESPKALLEAADANLYIAKNAGRNLVWPACGAAPRPTAPSADPVAQAVTA
jgi:diguanylate cyclase (GGDEF)-like protein